MLEEEKEAKKIRRKKIKVEINEFQKKKPTKYKYDVSINIECS